MENQMNESTQRNGAASAQDFLELLAFSGLSPEVFRALTAERVAEYRRALAARKQRAAEAGVADLPDGSASDHA